MASDPEVQWPLKRILQSLDHHPYDDHFAFVREDDEPRRNAVWGVAFLLSNKRFGIWPKLPDSYEDPDFHRLCFNVRIILSSCGLCAYGC